MKRPAPKGISSTNPYYWNRHYHSKHDWEWVGRTILVLLFFHFAYQWYSTQRKQKEYLAQEKERQRHSRLLLETTASGKTEKREAAVTKGILENECKMRTPSEEDTGVEQTQETQTQKTSESCPVVSEGTECAPKEDVVKTLSNNNVNETNINDDEGGVDTKTTTTTTTSRTPNPSRLLLVADTKKKKKNNNARKTPQKLPYKKVISNFEETVQKLGKEHEESTKPKHKPKHLPVASLKDDRMYDPMYSFWEWCTVQCSLFRTFTLERADGIPVTPPYLDANHFVNNIHKHSNVQGTIPMQFQVTNEYPNLVVAAYWYNVETAMAEYKGMIYPGETWCPNTYNDHPWIFAMVINPGKAVTDVSQQQVIFYYVPHRIIPDPQKHHQDDNDDNNNNTGLAHHFFIHPPTSSNNKNSKKSKSKEKNSNQQSNQNYYCSINDPMFPFPPSDCLTTPRLAVQWTLDYCLYRVEYTHWNILLKYLRNIVQDPHNVQYRQLKLSPNTSTFAQKVWNTPARGLLLAVGFQEQHTTTTTTTTSSSSSSDCEKSKTQSKSQLSSLLSDYVELPWTTDMTDNINELIQAIEHYQQLQQERREQQMVKHSSYQQQQQQQSNQDVSAAYQQQPIIHYHH